MSCFWTDSTVTQISTDENKWPNIIFFFKADVDLIVVLIHFGQELQIEPLPYQRHIAKHLISLGVQIIIGAHPHVLQPHCFHNNTLVAYSLGNFLFHPRRTGGGSDRVICCIFMIRDNHTFEVEEHEWLAVDSVWNNQTCSSYFKLKCRHFGNNRNTCAIKTIWNCNFSDFIMTRHEKIFQSFWFTVRTLISS